MCKKSLNWKQVEVPKLLSEKLLEAKQFEFCVCKFSVDGFKLLVIGIYRSPGSNCVVFLDRLSILINFYSKKYKHIVLGGDINIDVLKNDANHKMLKNTLKCHNMRYLVNFPTRVTENSETAIDNFIIKNLNSSILSVEGIITCLSDHDGQLLHFKNLKFKPEKEIPIKREARKFSTQNINYFIKLLENELWGTVYMAPVDEKYNEFSNILSYYFNESFPKSIVAVRKRKQNWLSEDLKNEKIELIKLAKETRRKNTPLLHELLKQRRNSFKINLTQAKTRYFENKIGKSLNIQKAVWEIINHEVGDKNKNHVKNISIMEGNTIITDPRTISNYFNNYFVNFIEDNRLNEPSNCNLEDIDSTVKNHCSRTGFMFKTVSIEEVENVISSLKYKNSSGYDEIPIKVIKSAKGHLSRILCHLINSSFISGIFPKQLKISKVIPIYKKNDDKSMSNYRPISLLPVVSKIYEKIANNQLTEYLESTNKLSSIQHGFRTGKSVISAAVAFIESLIESVDSGEYTVGIFMDLSKAFDSVNHSLLIKKLQLLGLTKNAIKWFESYLDNRLQFVEITHITQDNRVSKYASETQIVKLGVPQGSIIGPLLFLCYINDIPNSLTYASQKNLCLYADDANLKISAKSKDQVEILSFIELANIGEFLEQHNLKLNVEKTNFIRFKTQQNKFFAEPKIVYDCYEIESKTETQFLGVTMDQHLSWDIHIGRVVAKVSSGIYSLYRMSFFCNQETLRNIYFANIHSHISFGLCLYGSASKKNMDSILKLQKRAIRIIMKLKYDESAKEHFKALRILTVYGQYILDTILIAKNNETPLDFNYKPHPYNTRNKNYITKTCHNLKFYEKKPTYVGMKFFLNLPSKIKNITNMNKFKKELKEFLVEKALYSLEDFSTSY